MKYISDIKEAITDKTYFVELFEKSAEKNILFMAPQLSGKYLYKMIFPFICLYNPPKIKSALSELTNFDPIKQLIGGKETELTDDMIKWADYIVFPFTTQPLVAEIYDRIRKLSKKTKIVYYVDFNFYELSEKHPYKYIFNEPEVIDAVEENMFYSDIVLVTNIHLRQYLIEKFTKLFDVEKKKNQNGEEEYAYYYRGIPIHTNIGCLAIFIDFEVALANVDYDAQNPTLIKAPELHTKQVKDLIQKTSKTADIVRKSNSKKNKQKTVAKTKNKPTSKINLVSKNKKSKSNGAKSTKPARPTKKSTGSNSGKSKKSKRK